LYSGLDQDSLRTHIQDWLRTHSGLTLRTGSGLIFRTGSGLVQDSHSGLDQDSFRTHIQNWFRTGSGLIFRTGSGLDQDSYSGLDQDSFRTHIQDWIRTHTQDWLRTHTYSGLVLWNRFGMGAGSGRSAGEEWKEIGTCRKSFRAGGKQIGLGFNSCIALSCTQCPILESRLDRKGNRGNQSRYSDWRYRRKHLSIYTNYVFHLEQVQKDGEWVTYIK